MGLRNKIKEKYEARAAKIEQKWMEKLIKAAERKSPVVVEYKLVEVGDVDYDAYGVFVNSKWIETVPGDSRTAQRRAEQIEKILREKGFEVL
ncbi:MAG: hypothetical protein WBC40_11990 [Halobacteriota archaeon]